jgi:hypothetical protein
VRGVLLVLCACGRIGFGPIGAGDAAGNAGDGARDSDGASAAGFTIDGQYFAMTSGSTIAAVPTGSASAGEFIFVIIAQQGGTVPVTGIGDNQDTFQLAVSSTDASCPSAIEIWYAQAKGGAGAFTGVTMAANANAMVWIIWLGGATTVAGTAKLDSQGSTTVPMSSSRPAPNVPAAYFAAVQSCGNLLGIGGPPFTAEAPHSGGDAAYYLSAGTSAAQAAWASSNATYTSSIIEVH